jgi:hypothetical protein
VRGICFFPQTNIPPRYARRNDKLFEACHQAGQRGFAPPFRLLINPAICHSEPFAASGASENVRGICFFPQTNIPPRYARRNDKLFEACHQAGQLAFAPPFRLPINHAICHSEPFAASGASENVRGICFFPQTNIPPRYARRNDKLFEACHQAGQRGFSPPFSAASPPTSTPWKRSRPASSALST